MKNLEIFFFFLILGILIPLGYFFYRDKNTGKVTNTPKVKNNILKFDISNAPKNSLKAKIISLNGKVEWQSRTATQASAIKETQIIQQGEELKTGDDGSIVIAFENEATISLMPKSHLIIAQTLPVNLVFGQTEGTVDFTNKGNAPISVRSLSILININQGETKINVDKERSLITINSIKGGGVAAFNDLDNKSNVIPFEESNVYIFDDIRRSFITE